MVTVLVYWSDDDFNPSVFTAKLKDAWTLWWVLTKNFKDTESNPKPKKVVLKDMVSGTVLNPEKGSQMSLSNTY